MQSMMTGLGPVGAPLIASYMAGMTNHCVNSMEIAAGMHAHAAAIRLAAAQYAGTDELHAVALAAEQTMNEDLAQGKELLGKTLADPNLGQTVEAALPISLKDKLPPIDPGQTQFIGDIASTRQALEKAGIKGADLGIPAKGYLRI